jgi:hypothetical protein
MYLMELADELNLAGLDMRRVLKPAIDIPWTLESAKTFLWKPIQDIMFAKKSTTELNTDEVSKVYEVLNRHIATEHKISVPFPSIESLMMEDLYKKHKLL